MTKYWSREDTQHWIAQLENRIEDIDYHLMETIRWCEDNEIYDDQLVFACALMTVIWVSHMRNEPISKREAMEILGVLDWERAPDEEFLLGQRYQDLDLFELLARVARLNY